MDRDMEDTDQRCKYRNNYVHKEKKTNKNYAAMEKQAKCLGLILDSKLTYTPHIAYELIKYIFF